MISFHTFCTTHYIKTDESLSNFDIIDYMKKLKVKYFRGCYMRDTLPKKIKTNECGVTNLQPDIDKGSHWISYYKNGKNKIYFDSYGLMPCNELVKYLKPTKNSSPIVCSTFIIQKFGTVICGQLCIYVLYMLDKGYKFLDILLSLMEEIHNIKQGRDLNSDLDLVHDVSLIAELLL